MSTRATRIPYTKDRLDNAISRDRARLVGWVLPDTTNAVTTEPEQINRDLMIHFVCNCGVPGYRRFRALVDSGAFCEAHAKAKQQEKFEATSLDIYGFRNPIMNSTVRAKANTTIQERYEVANISQSPAIKEKKKITTTQTLGVPFTFQSPVAREKSKATNRAKLGVDFPTQSPIVKAKVVQSNLERTGYEYPSQNPASRAKAIATWIANLGTDNPLKCPDVQEKIRVRMIELYGHDNPSKCPAIRQKVIATSYGSKVFAMPSGKERVVQGYEPHALKILLNEGIKEDDILTGTDIPTVEYEHDGKTHTYYPDILIRSQNRIIEVKSVFTLLVDLEVNITKQHASIRSGFDFDFMVFAGPKAKSNNTPALISAEELIELLKTPESIISIIDSCEADETNSENTVVYPDC